MQFPQNTVSATPARYLFKLVSTLGELICNPEPLDWDSGMLEFKRDLNVGGVFSSFQLDSLTFVGNSAKLLKELWESDEFNAKCDLVVYYFDELTRTYIEFPSRFNINFNFYETVKVGKFAFGIKVKAINSSTQTKLDNRDDISIDISKLVSIGGFNIVDYEALTGTPLKKYLNYDAVNEFNFAELGLRLYGEYDMPRLSGYTTWTSVPVDMIMRSDFSEVNKVPYVKQQVAVQNFEPFFKNALFDYTFSMSIYVMFQVLDKHEGNPWTLTLYEVQPDNTIVNEYELYNFGASTGTFIYWETLDYNILAGNSFKLGVRVANNTGIKAYLIVSRIEITQAIASSPAKATEGFPIYEAFERTLQHILDTQFPFYSEFFGRNDVVYNLNLDTYTDENQLRFAHIQSGLNLRGADIDDPNNPIGIKFKDLFKCAQSIWNVGYGFEMRDDFFRVRIEPYSYFFQNVQVLDISDRINKYDITSAVMPELVPITLESGFNNAEYLTLNGRDEPNTTNRRTTVMNTSAKYDNISPIRGDSRGIFSNLSQFIEDTGTSDTRSDNELFIVKTQRSGTDEWKTELDENIEVLDNTSIYKNALLNRYFTPSRMLKRHGNRIKAGLTKFLSSYLRFQTSEKLQTLRTRGKTGTGIDQYDITENEDILVNDLENPIYKPIKHMAECYFDYADLSALTANPFGYIRFSDTLTGYILSLKKKNNEAKAEITIIEKY